MKSEVVIIRHGKTEGNQNKIMAGSTESPLSSLGRSQSIKTGEALLGLSQKRDSRRGKRTKKWFQICNYYGRAVNTARLILGVLQGDQGPLEIQKDQRLRERHLGIWEGKTYEDYVKHLIASQTPLDDITLFPLEGGESSDEMKARAKEFFEELCTDIVEQCLERVLLVTHGIIQLQLLKLLVRDYSCSLPPGEEEHYLRVRCPNNGITSLILTFSEEGSRKLENVECVTLYDKKHIE